VKYSYWIDYPSFSIAIQTNGGSFRCVKFVDKKAVRGAEKTLHTLSDLKDFLLTLPYPPKDQISEVMDTLGKD
jgi:hypothetical protein